MLYGGLLSGNCGVAVGLLQCWVMPIWSDAAMSNWMINFAWLQR